MALSEADVSLVISGYIRENGGTLNTMDNIYQRLVGERKNFSRWHDTEREFLELEWDEELSRRFLEYAKNEIEENQDTISQAYLDIIHPEEIDADTIYNELEAHQVTSQNGGREGFQATRRDDGLIEAEYLYYSEDVHVTADLEIDSIPDQKRIPFRVDPEKRLVIVRNTQPSKVIKLNSVLNNTVLETTTTGNIKTLPKQQAKQIIRNFVRSFEKADTRADGGSSSDKPKVDEVVEVDMYNPNMDRADPVQKADLEGEYHIFDSDQVTELRSEGWYERGVGIKMTYRNRIYRIKVAGKERIGYVKIEDIEDIDRGKELLSKIRSRYLEHFRVLPSTKGLY